MTVLLIMIPLSLAFVIGAGWAFFWAVNHDQFDDMQTPSLLPMSDDLPQPLSESPDATGHTPDVEETGGDRADN